MTPQIVYIALSLLSLALHIRDHNKPLPPRSAVNALVALVIGWTILWWGGFWEPLLRAAL